MVSADTNLLVRLITRDDEKHATQAEAFMEGGAWVSHLVIAETIWVLAKVYGRGFRDQIQILDMLLKHESLIIEDSDTVAAALDIFRSRPKLRFTDCLILETARNAGHLPLGTFDRNLSTVDGAARV